MLPFDDVIMTCNIHGENIIDPFNLLPQIDGLVQERRNSRALAMELRLSCINQSKSSRRFSSGHHALNVLSVWDSVRCVYRCIMYMYGVIIGCFRLFKHTFLRLWIVEDLGAPFINIYELTLFSIHNE